MSKVEKLLKKARNNPSGLSFDDFENLLAQLGWILKRQEGSHRIYISPQGYRLSVQPRGAKAKGYQVRQLLKQYDMEV